MKLKEAAQILGVSESWMQKLLNGKRGPNRPRVVRIGNHYRIPAQEFFDWANRQSERWPALRQGKP